MEQPQFIFKNEDCSLYKIVDFSDDLVSVFISSTNESRSIINDPLICGIEYTKKLQSACTYSLKNLVNYFNHNTKQALSEKNTCILNILRGGLNFGLREAIAEAFDWNLHSAAFLSAQRARKTANPEEWYITESSYQKVFLPESSTIVFGDVVATGTSLEFALNELLNIARTQNQEISSLIFFTIGGPRSHQILKTISLKAKEYFPSFKGSNVVYLEGCFDVADQNSKLSIKYTGTDLLRSNSILAKEFIDSQNTKPTYPIERCTIYDAGSRAFWVNEYLEDVIDYWKKTLVLAKNGMTYRGLIEERFPELLSYDNSKIDLDEISLIDICEDHLKNLEKIL